MVNEKEFHTSLGHVVVTGGCGFLGTNIVKLILEQSPESIVSALDVRTTNQVDSERVFYHACDITDGPAIHELFQKLRPDVVIHTAAIVLDKATEAIVSKVNVDGTRNLIEAARDAEVKAFVYTSSSSVIIGDVDQVINADESWPLLVGKDQPEFYSRTKAQAEALVIEANRSSPTFLTAAIRPAGIFGEHDTLLLYKPMLIRGFKKYFQLGTNDNLFDCTYVVNVAHAHLLAAKALLTTNAMSTAPLDFEKVDGEAFLITNGTPVYFWDLMRVIWQARGLPEDKAYDVSKVWVLSGGLAIFLATIIEFLCALVGKQATFTRFAVRQSAMIRYFCIDKARMRLKYEPLYSIQEGIARGAKDCLERANAAIARGE